MQGSAGRTTSKLASTIPLLVPAAELAALLPLPMELVALVPVLVDEPVAALIDVAAPVELAVELLGAAPSG
jgi:hypothetical protein